MTLRPHLAIGALFSVLSLPAGAQTAPPAVAAAEDGDRVNSLRPVEVLGQTPVPGFNVPLAQYPGNVQQADDSAIERAKSGNLAEFLNRNLTGVTVNDIQGSPYQVDVNYRGHRLSPLLGSAQGLSVYVDGVRVNEPFGDIMNWDLLPESAIASLSLVPGSNPLFGLNTLGGALVLTTKSGLTHKGTEIDMSLGSFGRKRLEIGHGWQWGEGWHGFVSATAFQETGWRERSPGDLSNLFAKVGRQHAGTDWSLSYTHARSNLTGNGLLNQSLYNLNRSAGYTFTDVTRNRADTLNFQGSHTLGGGAVVSAQAWARRTLREASNGDISATWADWLEGCETTPKAAACTQPNNPGYITRSAVLNSSSAQMSELGAGLQWAQQRGAHQLSLGGMASRSLTRYDQYNQDGFFDSNRVTQVAPGAPVEHTIAMQGRSSTVSLFANDRWALGERTHLNLSARWNQTQVSTALGQPVLGAAETFTYRRLNPAIGLTHAYTPELTVFGNLSQGTRVPTALELGCADPAKPCVLPTGLQSDPYLKQVVARTAEVGLRAKPFAGAQLTAALFRTDSQDDIIFVRSGISQAGYFTNIGLTRRQGLELSGKLKSGAWQWRADWAYLDATYQSSGVLPGPLSTATKPNTFKPGTPIAGLPQQVLKFGFDWRATPAVRVGADWVISAKQTASGNESGTRPVLYDAPGYAVVNARGSWQVTERWQAYLRVNNVLDKRFETFATGNQDPFPRGVAVQPGQDLGNARFVAPGAPRSLALGLRYEWD